MTQTRVHGLLAEFNDGEELVAAAKRAYEQGYRRMEAYSPLPVHGLAEATGFHGTSLPWVVFAGGLLGCLSGYGLCYYMAALSYPHNIGGRPLNSWPMYIPITFELTVLFSALAAVFGMIVMNGLPLLYHPVFNAPQFSRASKDGFFLCLEANDPAFDLHRTREFLEQLHPREVVEVDA